MVRTLRSLGKSTPQSDVLGDWVAAAPRKFGFAPEASGRFLSVEERQASRSALSTPSTRAARGDLLLELLHWAIEHIKSKAMHGAVPWKAGCAGWL